MASRSTVLEMPSEVMRTKKSGRNETSRASLTAVGRHSNAIAMPASPTTIDHAIYSAVSKHSLAALSISSDVDFVIHAREIAAAENRLPAMALSTTTDRRQYEQRLSTACNWPGVPHVRYAHLVVDSIYSIRYALAQAYHSAGGWCEGLMDKEGAH